MCYIHALLLVLYASISSLPIKLPNVGFFPTLSLFGIIRIFPSPPLPIDITPNIIVFSLYRAPPVPRHREKLLEFHFQHSKGMSGLCDKVANKQCIRTSALVFFFFVFTILVSALEEYMYKQIIYSSKCK